MKYLITGGCGFIGVNFAEKLLKRGDRVVLLDNLSRKGTVSNLNYLLSNFDNVAFEHADIRVDSQKMVDLVSEVDAVYHLASQVAVTTSVKNPKEDFDINALGTFNLLEAVRMSSRKPLFLYASTNKVYGGMEDIEVVEGEERYSYKSLPHGINESQTLDFHSPYGCSKGSADQYVRDYSRIYDLQTVVMRQSCIYGPRQFGIEDQGWVAWFTIASMFGHDITIYGNGKQVRDVLYVDDLFEAWDIATKKIKNTSGKIYNVGGGSKRTLSLLDLLELLEEIKGSSIKVSYSDWRPGDQPVYVSDISKIEQDLGWTPKISARAGVKKLYGWVEKNKDLVKSTLGL